MKVPFKLIYAPSKDLKTRCMRGRYRKMPQSEMENLTRGMVTEERLHTLATMCCPFCMERYYNSFYSNRYDAYMNALQAGTAQQKFGSDQHEMRRAGETEEVYFRRGIIENEVEIARWWSKEKWFKKTYHCVTCGADYESLPYRKNKYVQLQEEGHTSPSFFIVGNTMI